MEKRFFTAWAGTDRDHYRHLEIELHREDWGSDPLLEFSWISGDGGEKDLSEATRLALKGWYGFRVEIKTDCLQRVLNAVKALRRILHKPEPEDPTSIVARLLKAGYVQAVYDSRHHKLVTKSECLPPDVLRWMDDCAVMHREHITEDCMARTAEEARPLIAAALAQKGDFAYLQEWVAAGQPVRTPYGATPPTWSDVADMIALAKPETTTTETTTTAA